MRALSLLRKFVVLAIGLPLLALGIVLIPLPGPGLLICFVAFGILSIEFSWARTGFNKSKSALAAIIRTQMSKAKTDDSGKQPVDRQKGAKDQQDN